MGARRPPFPLVPLLLSVFLAASTQSDRVDKGVRSFRPVSFQIPLASWQASRDHLNAPDVSGARMRLRMSGSRSRVPGGVLVSLLRGGGKSKKKIERAKQQERVLASIGKTPRQPGKHNRGGGTGIKREKTVRYKAGTKGYLAFPGPHLYAIGGRAGRDDLTLVHRLDVTTDTWGASVPLRAARSALHAVRVDGRIYAVGGMRTGTALGAMQSLAPLSGDTDWREEPALPSPRRFSAVAAVGSLIVVAGGAWPTDAADKDTSLAEVVCLDTGAGTGWRPAAPMPTARRHAAAAALDGRVYVLGGWCAPAGGCGSAGKNLATVESYDPATDAWRAEPPLPTARRSLQAVALGGRLFAIGGAADGAELPTVESFCPREGRWRVEAPLQQRRSAFAAAAFNGCIYVAGVCGAAEHKTVETLDVAAAEAARAAAGGLAGAGTRWESAPPLPARRWALALAAG